MKALIVLDVQEGSLKLPQDQKVLDTIMSLIHKFKINNDEVILTQHLSEDKESMFNILKDEAKIYEPFIEFGDAIIQKYQPNAFLDSSLGQYLKLKKITEVYITGLNSLFAPIYTAIDAYEKGFKVSLVKDGVIGLYQNSIFNIQSLLKPKDIKDELLKKGLIKTLEYKEM